MLNQKHKKESKRALVILLMIIFCLGSTFPRAYAEMAPDTTPANVATKPVVSVNETTSVDSAEPQMNSELPMTLDPLTGLPDGALSAAASGVSTTSRSSTKDVVAAKPSQPAPAAPGSQTTVTPFSVEIKTPSSQESYRISPPGRGGKTVYLEEQEYTIWKYIRVELDPKTGRELQLTQETYDANGQPAHREECVAGNCATRSYVDNNPALDVYLKNPVFHSLVPEN